MNESSIRTFRQVDEGNPVGRTMASRATLLPFQLLVAALTLGPVLFLGVLFTFDFGPRNDVPFLGDFMTFTAIGMACVALVVNVTLSVVLRRWAARSDATSAIVPFGIRTIGGALVFVWAAFTASAAMMTEQSPAAFIVAICMIFGIASRFPTPRIARRWLRSDLI